MVGRQHFGNRGYASAVIVDAREQHGSRGRTERGGMVVAKLDAAFSQSLNGRHLGFAAKGREIRQAGIIHQNYYHIGALVAASATERFIGANGCCEHSARKAIEAAKRWPGMSQKDEGDEGIDRGCPVIVLIVIRPGQDIGKSRVCLMHWIYQMPLVQNIHWHMI